MTLFRGLSAGASPAVSIGQSLWYSPLLLEAL